SLSAAAAVPGISSLSLHDALPILVARGAQDDHPLLKVVQLEAGRLELLTVALDLRFELRDGRQRGVEVVNLLLERGEPRLGGGRSEEHTSELQSRENLVCRLQLDT